VLRPYDVIKDKESSAVRIQTVGSRRTIEISLIMMMTGFMDNYYDVLTNLITDNKVL